MFLSRCDAFLAGLCLISVLNGVCASTNDTVVIEPLASIFTSSEIAGLMNRPSAPLSCEGARAMILKQVIQRCGITNIFATVDRVGGDAQWRSFIFAENGLWFVEWGRQGAFSTVTVRKSEISPPRLSKLIEYCTALTNYHGAEGPCVLSSSPIWLYFVLYQGGKRINHFLIQEFSEKTRSEASGFSNNYETTLAMMDALWHAFQESRLVFKKGELFRDSTK